MFSLSFLPICSCIPLIVTLFHEKYILIFYCNFRKILFFPIKYSYKLHKVSATIIIINGTAFNKYLELLSQKAKNKIVPIKIRYKIVKGSLTSFFLMRIIPPVSINVKSIFQYILLYVFIQILTKLDSWNIYQTAFWCLGSLHMYISPFSIPSFHTILLSLYSICLRRPHTP